jgi:hypothetical protein
MNSYYDSSQMEAISKLKKLKSKLGQKNPKHRIDFALTVFKAGLYQDLIAYDLYDKYGLGGRDLDTCFEMNDGEVVVHGIMTVAQEDLDMERNIKKTGSWNSWMETFSKQEKQSDIFA